MANTVIQLKKSATPASVPGSLANGELAINYADGIIYYKAANGTIAAISSGGQNYGIVNANGTLLLAGTSADKFTLLAGDNIGIEGNAVDDTILLSANLGPAFDVANAAFAKANTSGPGGAARVNVAVSPPGSPSVGDLWWDTNSGRLFVYYTDVDSSQWVETSPSGGGIPDISAVYEVANSAYGFANDTYGYIANTTVSANGFAGTLANSANGYTTTVGAAGNAYTNVIYGYVNTSMGFANQAGVIANTGWSSANQAGIIANASFVVANQSGVIANAAFGHSNLTYNAVNSAFDVINAAFTSANASNAFANTVGISANNYANASFYTIANGQGAFTTSNSAYTFANNIAIDSETKGFLDQLETYLRFDTTSNTFTLADSGAGWSYWIDGKRYTISGNSTVSLGAPLANGTYYISIENNQTGTLTGSSTAWNLSDPANIPVAYVKYNSLATPKYFIAEERHTVLMDSRTHRYLHFTRGTQAQQFGALSGYTVTGTTNTHNMISISTTILNDEDIILTIPAKTATLGNSSNYFVFYRYATGAWSWQSSDLPYIAASGGFIEYDSASGPVETANNTYVNSYLFFTNLDQGAGFAIIPGRTTYATLQDAQAEDATTFDMTGFGVLESVVAYQLTWRTDSTLTTTGKCQLATAPRKIGTAVASVTPVYTSGLHNDLGGLQGGSTNERYHLSASEYGTLQSNVGVAAFAIANAAFDKANSANVLAYDTGIGANNHAGVMANAANAWSNTKLSNTGGISFAGDLFFPTGNIGIGTTSATSPLTIIEGTVTPITLVNDLIDAEGDANSTVQVHVRNANTGLLGSTDFIATADNGTDTTNYIDLGINGSGYADPNWTINAKNDGYLYVSDSNLAIGAANSTVTNKYVSFFVGGLTAADEVMRIQDSTGGANVGIGRINPGYKLDVVGTINASAILVNGSAIGSSGLANVAGTVYAGNLGISTAATSLLTIGGGGTAAGSSGLKLVSGSRLTTPEAGAFEFDSTDTVLHLTENTTQGRCLIPATQYYRLTADGSNIGGTIADFFGTNSSIPLVASGVYEIEIMVYFLKNTAGTVTWTLTNSTTVTSMNAQVLHTPLAGYTAVPTGSTTNTAALFAQTAAAAAFTATGSLTNNTSHYAIFKILLENGASTSLRLRVTCSAGTVTPRRNSYWKATRISSTNAGTYSA